MINFIFKEITSITKEVRKVSICKSLKNQSRFAIITYKTHRDAAMARRHFVPIKVNLFGKGVSVDWAVPDFKADNVVNIQFY